MPIVNIDGKEHDLDSLPAEAKQLIQRIQFVDTELQRLVSQDAVLKAARISFSIALKDLLGRKPDTPFGGDTIKL